MMSVTCAGCRQAKVVGLLSTAAGTQACGQGDAALTGSQEHMGQRCPSALRIPAQPLHSTRCPQGTMHHPGPPALEPFRSRPRTGHPPGQAAACCPRPLCGCGCRQGSDLRFCFFWEGGGGRKMQAEDRRCGSLPGATLTWGLAWRHRCSAACHGPRLRRHCQVRHLATRAVCAVVLPRPAQARSCWRAA